MTTSLSILLVGFMLGLKHASEADHLAAVATLATRQSSLATSMQQGLAWGLGHTLTLLLFGGAVLALGEAIPQPVALGLEFAVGIMLVVLGADVLRRLVRQRIHIHVHSHGPSGRHVHAHSHAGEGAHSDSAHEHAHPKRLPVRALAVGMMHGMAGSAALVVLSLGAVRSWVTGLVYIFLFGAGSMVGMVLLSVAIAVPLRLTARHVGWLYNSLTAAIGVASCVLGLATLYRIGIVERLSLG